MGSTPGNTKVYGQQGGDYWRVKSGGGFIFETGSSISMAGGTIGISMSGTYTGSPIQLGTNAIPIPLVDYTNRLMEMYSTSGSTDGANSVRSLYSKTTMTGAGGVGGRAEFHLYTDVALGGWSNAGKFFTEYGANGKTTGLGSSLCAEMQLSAGTTSGTYAPIEAEILSPAGCSTGSGTSFIYVNGTDASGLLNDNGCLFQLGSVFTSNIAHMWYANQAAFPANMQGTVRFRLPNGVVAYLPYLLAPV